MKNYELKLTPIEAKLGHALDPQPVKSDYWEKDDSIPGLFNFFIPNQRHGGFYEFAFSIKSNDLNIEPKFDARKKLWIWVEASNKTRV